MSKPEIWRLVHINAELPNASFYTMQFENFAVLPLEDVKDKQQLLKGLAEKDEMKMGSIGDAYGAWRVQTIILPTDWVNIKNSLPKYYEEVEVSFDGETFECMGRFVPEAKCMLAYGDSGFGRFKDKFEDLENNLVLSDVTHWRYKTENNDTIKF